MSTWVSLDEAVLEIRRACDGAPKLPFFFIVGAGVSYPSIPLAATIISQCSAKYEADRVKYPTLKAPRFLPSQIGIETYSEFFELAYPQPIDRAAYLKNLILGKPISGATLRLAHLLTTGKVGRLVVTPNFDDLIGRALNLFGQSFIDCDHPYTTGRIEPDRIDNVIQTIHVHGTYWFYDCCNLSYEIAAQAHSEQDLGSMPMLLGRILHERSPIVVGYSGWENDIIMGTLRRRLSDRPPYNVYWFCYSRQSFDDLPEWLRDHENLRFIVPDEPVQADPLPEASNEEHRNNAVTGSGSELSSESEQYVPETARLTAREVFDALNKAFDLDEPQLTAAPLHFFAERLRNEVALQSTPISAERFDRARDLYDLTSVVQRIERASELERVAIDPNEQFIEEIRSAVRRSDYEAVISLAESRPREVFRDLADPQLESLIASLESTATGLESLNPRILDARRLALDAYQELYNRNQSSTNAIQFATALLRKAKALQAFRRNDEARSVLDTLLGNESLKGVSGIEAVIADAKHGLGVLNVSRDEVDEGLAVFRAIVHEYGSSTQEDVQIIVAQTLRRISRYSARLDNLEETRAAYADLRERFRTAKGHALRHQLAYGMRDQARILNRKELYHEVVEIGQESVDIFGDEEDKWIIGTALGTEVQLATAFFFLCRYDEALASAKNVVQRGRDGSSRNLSDQDIARAYGVIVGSLRALKRRAEASQEVEAAKILLAKTTSESAKKVLAELAKMTQVVSRKPPKGDGQKPATP